MGSTTHFILQGKGGVGKSMIASLLYQYLDAKGHKVTGFDTDPENHTLSSYKEFTVKEIDVLDSNDNINARKWDTLLDDLCDAPDGSQLIVDNGASSFVALAAYIRDNDMVGQLADEGHEVFLHTVVTGGQAILDTLAGLKKLCILFPDKPIVVWLNPFFGEIEMDGKKFEEFKVYQEHNGQFRAVLRLPTGNRETLGKDLEELFAKRMSFNAAIHATQTHRAVRKRLERFWHDFVELVDMAGLAPSPEPEA